MTGGKNIFRSYPGEASCTLSLLSQSFRDILCLLNTYINEYTLCLKKPSMFITGYAISTTDTYIVINETHDGDFDKNKVFSRRHSGITDIVH